MQALRSVRRGSDLREPELCMNFFETLMRGINRIPFILQIVLGMCLGIVLALIVPGDKVVVPVCGVLFVSALKAIAPLLVFVLVAAAIARQEAGGSATKMKPILLLYFASMLISSMAALCASYLFPSTFPTLAQAASNSVPKAVSEVILNVLKSAVDNPINALATGNYIAILVWGVAFGILFRKASSATKDVLLDLAATVSGVVTVVIRFAPLGVMGLVFSSCTQPGGFANLLNYVHVVGVLVITMLFIAFIANPILVFLMTRKNPYPLVWTCIVHSGLYAFFTRSSAANLPINLHLCKRLGVPQETYTVSIPLGCTINMSGAAVTIVIMTMAAVHTLGVNVSFGAAFLMCVAAVFCACGSSGVAGGSLMLIPLACSIFGISNDIAMQVVGIGFIIGVIQDSCETALNSSSDVLFTATACGCTSGRMLPLEKKEEAKA